MKRLLSVLLAAAGACVLTQAVFADKIRLKNKTEVSGDVLQISDDSAIIRVPRDKIATVNGEALPAPVGVGAPAPAFTATDLNGKQVSVGPPNKAKATLVHFWVHWCPHCRSDAPQIQAIYDQYKDNPKVQVITLNLDKEKDKVLSVVSERKMTYPVVMTFDAANHTTESDYIHERYQVQGFPLTFLIDEQGVVRYKRSGSFVEMHEDLRAEIEKLLAKG